ncbi:hypothetical protein PVNG_00080 [Plasmodium vivax North Korean]|uniref:SMP-30/Gluconolactonase/LRE-like region domain-containing protein n=1 Tax=Plasmodium vivax North Korean TaxID=1035514 RepID=A0A0J9TQI2_PLAVI|nr:hypothetical protein PVNG_00080 [Plasmodium vivax North Korean]
MRGWKRKKNDISINKERKKKKKMDTCDYKLNANYPFNVDEARKKKKKEKKNIEIFYENDSDLYSPCLDVEGALCVITAGGEILRYKLKSEKWNGRGRDESASTSSSSEEEGEDDTDEGGSESGENGQSEEDVQNGRKKTNAQNAQNAQRERYHSTDIEAECLCADNDYNFYVFDPMTRGLMVINKKKEMELYTDEYEDEHFQGVNNLVYDKKRNILYVVDSGNLNEENKCNLFYVNKDIETMMRMDIPNMPYAHNLCVYEKGTTNDIYVCLTKENRIVRLMSRGNSYIKCHFLQIDGCYSPLFICTDNTNLVVLLKDLSGCQKRGKLLEIDSNGEVINSIFTDGCQFNGICYDHRVGKYFFIEGRVIYTY